MKKLLQLFLICFVSASLLAEKRHIEKPAFGSAFDFEITPLPEMQDCRGFSFRFPSAITTDFPINNTVPGEIYLPLNAKPDHQLPAVQIYHTIGPDKFQLEKKICQLLAKDGIVAAYFQMPYFGQRGGLLGPLSILRTEEAFFQGLEQMRADIILLTDIMLSFPEVNPNKIGAAGISLGALATANAAYIDRRIQRGLMIIGGGSLPDILATNTNETRDLLAFFSRDDKQKQEELYKKLSKYDPINLTEPLSVLAKNKKFAMINAQNDNVFPPKCSQMLADKIGCPIKWYQDVDHYSFSHKLPDAVTELRLFFRQDLPKPMK